MLSFWTLVDDSGNAHHLDPASAMLDAVTGRWSFTTLAVPRPTTAPTPAVEIEFTTNGTAKTCWSSGSDATGPFTEMSGQNLYLWFEMQYGKPIGVAVYIGGTVVPDDASLWKVRRADAYTW